MVLAFFRLFINRNSAICVFESAECACLAYVDSEHRKIIRLRRYPWEAPKDMKPTKSASFGSTLLPVFVPHRLKLVEPVYATRYLLVVGLLAVPAE